MHHNPEDAFEGDEPERFSDIFEDEDDKPITERLSQDANAQGFGATGQHPDGKLTEQDEGELKLGVTAYRGKVIMNFGDEMGWVGFTPNQARDIIQSLKRKAREARLQSQE